MFLGSTGSLLYREFKLHILTATEVTSDENEKCEQRRRQFSSWGAERVEAPCPQLGKTCGGELAST